MKKTKKTKSNEKVIFLIDGNNLLYRAYHKFKSFSSSNGQDTGCIYGFMKTLHSNIFRFRPDYVIPCFDTRRSKLRLSTYPTYKEKRKNIGMDFESLDRQRRVILRMLRLLGVSYVKDSKNYFNYEGDDYIAYLVKKHQKDKIYILSSDEDFIQLIDKHPNLTVVSPNKDLNIGKHNCEKVFGYKPQHAIDYKILVGDNSDNIKGYPGIGPKTALEFLNKFNSISNYFRTLETFRKVDNSKLKELYKVNNFMINLMQYIEDVPMDNLPLHLGKEEFNKHRFHDICFKYDLKSFMGQEFQDLFIKGTIKPYKA